MAHAKKSPYDADWLLYLSHVHRTNSMKERQRVWRIAEEIKRAYEDRRETAYSRSEWPEVSRDLDKTVDGSLKLIRDLTLANEGSRNDAKKRREAKERVRREPLD